MEYKIALHQGGEYAPATREEKVEELEISWKFKRKLCKAEKGVHEK